MAFCLPCGSPLAERPLEGRLREVCGRCGWVRYVNPVPAAAAIVRMDGGVVLVLRALDPRAGDWCLPSGFQESDESPEEACVRETREETGLEVEIESLHGLYFGRDDPRCRVVLAVYATKVVGGRLKAGDDALEARAFDLARLPDDVAFENHRRVLADLRRGAGC